jgi:hypothetical protein
MRKALAAAVLGLACLTAWDADADMNSAFGNTIVSRYPDGGWVKHWFEPDGSYSAHFSDGRRLTARWRLEGERVCLTNIRPNMLIPRFCSTMVEASIGDTWPSRDPLGRRVQNTLVAGRQ